MRRAFRAVIGLDLVLVVVGVLSYPPFLIQRGGVGYLTGPVVLLIGYTAAALTTPRVATKQLPTAALVELTAGGLEVVTISVETFLGRSRRRAGSPA